MEQPVHRTHRLGRRNGPGLIGLDADFLIASFYSSDDERRTTVGLFTIAGSPSCISDTVDTIADNAWVFQNPEVIALNKDGLAGKPLFNNNHGYNWATPAPATPNAGSANSATDPGLWDFSTAATTPTPE